MITFKTVTKEFGNGTVAVKDVSFLIEPGELTLITGPSGSGKTTLMKLLIKEHQPSAGEIFFKDQSLTSYRQLAKLRREIGVVFQDYKLLDELNVWENIALPLQIMGQKQSEIESRVTDLLQLVELADHALVFPSQLSGGEAQRVSIARALATAPKVIFADEPTGNLDPQTSNHIIKLLKKINELGTTVLLATHDAVVLDLLKKTRTLNLDQGELVTDTDPKKLKTTYTASDDQDNSDQKPSSSKSKTSSKTSSKKTSVDQDDADAKNSDKKNKKDKKTRIGQKLTQLTKLFRTQKPANVKANDQDQQSANKKTTTKTKKSATDSQSKTKNSTPKSTTDKPTKVAVKVEEL
ncbi:MAG: ATP-binding cassette domain-containing protein [Candidatus Pacebacteria bacterium]|nr:ATP-binding cassette domain-containing protein [Candidatus Paceibacterota bacterium]